MTDKQGAADYLAFLRGYVAALNRDPADLASEPPAYAEGFAAAAQPVNYTQRYRDVSIDHASAATGPGSGYFTGTLADLLRPEPI